MRICSNMSNLDKPLDSVGGFFLAWPLGGQILFTACLETVEEMCSSSVAKTPYMCLHA